MIETKDKLMPVLFITSAVAVADELMFPRIFILDFNGNCIPIEFKSAAL